MHIFRSFHQTDTCTTDFFSFCMQYSFQDIIRRTTFYLNKNCILVNKLNITIGKCLKFCLFLFFVNRFATAYTQSDYPVEVKLRQYLYFQASVKSKDKTLSVLTEYCYATPSQDRNHAAKYYLIKDA